MTPPRERQDSACHWGDNRQYEMEATVFAVRTKRLVLGWEIWFRNFKKKIWLPSGLWDLTSLTRHCTQPTEG